MSCSQNCLKLCCLSSLFSGDRFICHLVDTNNNYHVDKENLNFCKAWFEIIFFIHWFVKFSIKKPEDVISIIMIPKKVYPLNSLIISIVIFRKCIFSCSIYISTAICEVFSALWLQYRGPNGIVTWVCTTFFQVFLIKIKLKNVWENWNRIDNYCFSLTLN